MSYLLLEGGGGGFQPVVGKGGGGGSPALRFSGFLSGGLPEWGHLVKFGVWLFRSFRISVGLCLALFPGSTIVLEGIV